MAGRTFELGAQEHIIGRGSAAHIRLSDPGVSRRHARFLPGRGGVFEVEDLKSFNGTYVNGRRVDRAKLGDGDEVRVCRDVFRFEADVDEPAPSDLVLIETDASESVVGHIDATMISDLWEAPDLQAQDVEAMSRKLRAVVAVSEAISSTLDPDELFDRVLDQVLTSFPQAEKASVLIRNESTGKLEIHAVRTRDEEPSGQLNTFSGGLAVSHTVIHQVMSQGHAVVAQPLPEARDESGRPKRCRMGAPLIFQRQIKGLIHVDTTHARAVFSEEDLDLLTSIAMQTAVALQVSEFHQKALKQHQLEQDLQFARRVQQGFLPDKVPELPGFSFAAHYDPANMVGGDFYDFVPLEGGSLGIVVGDVSGHGVSAALFMARLSSHLRSFAVTEVEPARVLTRAHALLADNQDGMFATILYLVLDPAKRSLKMSNAGHMPPIIRRPAERDVRSLDEVTDLVLGVLPEARITEHAYQLGPGDTVLLYSDGVVEARNEAGQEYGVGRLQWLCGQGVSSAPEIVNRILRDFDRHVGRQDHPDDVTLVAFTVTG